MRTFLISTSIILLFSISIVVPAMATEDVRSVVEKWCVDQMSNWSPPSQVSTRAVRETVSEALDRYNEIARDAINIVYDPAETPLFKGKYGRAKTLGVLLSTLHSESTFRKDVELGLTNGDSGASWCMAQIKLSKLNKNGVTNLRIVLDQSLYGYVKNTLAGYGGEDLIRDRKICLRVALHMIRGSFLTCARKPLEERLSSYVSRDCDVGADISKYRMGRVAKWFKLTPPPFSDQEVVNTIAESNDLAYINTDAPY